MKRPTLLLGVSAGIAAYRACDMINCLRQNNIEVVVCLSKDAHHFVAPLALQTLSGNQVFQEMFHVQDDWSPVHIALSDRADITLVMPATSNIISKVATGICDDLLTCVIAASQGPVVFAPAMNEAMYVNKILQANIKKLKTLKYHFVSPIKGHLACGRQGMGHIADTKDIAQYVKTLLK